MPREPKGGMTPQGGLLTRGRGDDDRATTLHVKDFTRTKPFQGVARAV